MSGFSHKSNQSATENEKKYTENMRKKKMLLKLKKK